MQRYSLLRQPEPDATCSNTGPDVDGKQYYELADLVVMSFALRTGEPKQLEPRLGAAMTVIIAFALRFAAAGDALIAAYLRINKLTTVATGGDAR